MLVILAAYLIGSIPFALILARRWGAGDLRRVGSGNLGAANVFRTSGATPGIIVALLDAAKGAASVFLAQRWTVGAEWPAAAGVAAVLGHVFPVWAGFRGGKGVATAAGAFGVLAPAAALSALGVFATGAWATRYISFASVLAAAALPPIAYFSGSTPAVVTAAALAAVLIIVRHRTNLMRLRTGTERRIGG